MKKFLAIFLALMMVVGAAALAENTEAEQLESGENLYTQLVVGSTTPLSGCFFTEMWGSNASDIDVRMLLHGYNLMEWRSETGSYAVNHSAVSGLAVTDDEAGNRTYTISLYDDLYYSDGTQITARDYAFAILLSIAPEMTAIGAHTAGSGYITGIDAYMAGEAEALSGVRVLSDQMLSLTVKAEYRPFFYELALLDYCPYPIHVIAPGCTVEDNGEGVFIQDSEEGSFTADVLAKTVLDPETGYLSHPSVVSGPYTLLSFDWDTRVAEFAINPYYKGNSAGYKPSIPKLIVRPVQNDTMVDLLASGEVDLLHKCVSADVIATGMELTANAPVNVANYPRSGFSFISFCCEQPTVSSEKVRQAIAYCFDQNAIVADYVSNYGLAVNGYYGIGQWIYELVSGTEGAPVEEPAENATEAELAEYEETQAAWEALTLDNLPDYALDTGAARKLLVDDGWTLNREGKPFDAAKDDVRCKEIDGELVALELTMLYPEGNAIEKSLDATLVANLAQVGVKLNVKPVPVTELMDVYYRNSERDCDMIYLATNFATVFDPSQTFSPEDAEIGAANRTAIVDEELYNLAVDMRRTEPGDVLAYCQKWVAFQERFAEVLPVIPVYSNVYFDFYDNTFQEYDITANQTWSQAIVKAYLGDVMEEETGDEGDLEFIE
ncbi:MAG: ABC transporter substrate-binding protein [Clostridiales bacterium]|nr:ABC transporter substrate-binding protein [Clostridiales bacterium]